MGEFIARFVFLFLVVGALFTMALYLFMNGTNDKSFYYGAEFSEAMNHSLRQAMTYEFSLPQKATATKSKLYEIQEVVQGFSQVTENEVNFAYTNKVLNLIDTPTIHSFKVSNAFEGIIVACSNQSVSTKYIIAIGIKGEEKEVTRICKEMVNS